MPLTTDLKWFKLSEFRHPELIQEDAATFLDAVRAHFGGPLLVTSDARTVAENKAAGGSELSWHVKGRAFDLRWPATDALAFKLVDAIFAVAAADQWRVGHPQQTIELELVYSERDKHLHFAVKDNGSPNRLIVAAD